MFGKSHDFIVQPPGQPPPAVLSCFLRVSCADSSPAASTLIGVGIGMRLVTHIVTWHCVLHTILLWEETRLTRGFD